jgi:chromosomal replication initiator protein
MDILQAWAKSKEHLKSTLGDSVFDTWIMPLEPTVKDGRELVLQAPDNFFKSWVEGHYRQAIQEALKLCVQEGVGLVFETNTVVKKTVLPQDTESIPTKTARPKEQTSLNQRYTFDTFVVGPSNRHAHAYSLAVAKSPAKTYNPLFVYGGVGLGKTHLIQAVCHYARQNTTEKLQICYLPSEKFTNELIEAIQHHSTSNFRQKYRNVDILVIDDIHFIAGKESTQEEFFHTFNTLYDAHKQIIISSDRPPKEIANLQERLVSRFGWGLTTDIQPPDLETRVAILKNKVEREPVSVPDEAIFFIAQLIKTNIRELEGALVRTIAYSLLEEKPITLDLTKEVLKELLKEPQKLITVDFIQRCVSEEFAISLHELKTRRRTKNIVLPRQVAMYLSRELTDFSLPEIGDFFGGKDHTTVLHSYNKIKGLVNTNTPLKDRIDRIIKIIQQ